MYEFAYSRPSSLAEAVELISKEPEGKVLAGGMSLIPIMKYRLAQPSRLVDLNGLQELRGAKVDGEWLSIGAMTIHHEVASSSAVTDAIPALTMLAGNIGDVQVRHRGTIGGSIAHNDPGACYPAAVLGLDTKIETTQRTISGDDFPVGTMETVLKSNEIITRVHFRIPDVASYIKFPNMASRFSIVGVFVSRSGRDVRASVTGAGDRVFRLAEFEAALSDDFAPGAIDGVDPPADNLLSDLHGPAEYRAHLISVLTKRAVAECRALAS